MAKRRIEYMPLDDLLSAERNPKGHAPEVITASVDRFGWIEPIVIDERTGRIVAGHGRRDELARRRDDPDAEIPDGVVVTKGDVWTAPVVRGWASANDDEAEAAGVALNQGTIAGGWIREVLFPVLDHLATTSSLDGTGFTQSDLADLAVLAGPPPDLDALSRSHGDPDERDFWPILRIVVSPATKKAWDSLIGRLDVGDDPDQWVAAIVRLVSGVLPK